MAINQKVSLILGFLGIIVGLLFQFVLPPEIPLFYGLPQTEDQLAPKIMIVIPSLIAIFVVIINSVLTTRIDNIFLIKSLWVASISVSLLSVVTIIKIVFLVGMF